MILKTEPLSDEMARLSKEDRAEIYIKNRDERIKRSKARIKEMLESGEIATVDEVVNTQGRHYDKGDGFSKGNIYKLAHLGEIESVRMCQRCGSLDVNVRQVGYWEIWDSGKAICLDCGWEVENANIYIYVAESKLMNDYHVWSKASQSNSCGTNYDLILGANGKTGSKLS